MRKSLLHNGSHHAVLMIFRSIGKRILGTASGKPLLWQILLGFVAGVIFSAAVLVPQNGKYRKPSRYETDENRSNKALPATPGRNLADGKDRAVKTSLARSRILCLILTQPSTSHRAAQVKLTWAKRCDKFLFIGSSNDSSLGVLDAGLGEGREVLWGKTKFAFRHVYKEYLDDFEWFFKGDDDTYVIMEHLRLFLANYSARLPLYFGSELQVLNAELFGKNAGPEYMSGGAGYVLSREAVRLLVEDGLSKQACVTDDYGHEDLEMGECLKMVGVKAVDSRDEFGRGRFFVYQPWYHTRPGHMQEDIWYPRYYKYPEKDGVDCCSDTAISFHAIEDMNVMEYLIYHLNPTNDAIVR